MSLALLLHNVWDPDLEPDPDPKDPHVFWPPESGSISQMYGSGSGSFPFPINVLIIDNVPVGKL
jgi:hypothetical protein